MKNRSEETPRTGMVASTQAKRVLVVDDDRDVREMLVSVLVRRGLAVDEAADGQEALTYIAQRRYAMVLLDLLMPEVSGFAVIEALRPVESPPVVLVITGADRSAIESLDPKRIHGIVRKPFDPEEIASVVAACVEIKERSALQAMAIATMVAGGTLMALLDRLT